MQQLYSNDQYGTEQNDKISDNSKSELKNISKLLFERGPKVFWTSSSNWKLFLNK